jgi:hypothetical protein
MEKRKPVTHKFPEAWLARLEAYCARQKYPPTKTAVIERAVTELLDREEKRERRGR